MNEKLSDTDATLGSLLLQAIEGDESAWSELNDHIPRLVLRRLRHLGSPKRCRCDEISQDVMLFIFDRKDELKFESVYNAHCFVLSDVKFKVRRAVYDYPATPAITCRGNPRQVLPAAVIGRHHRKGSPVDAPFHDFGGNNLGSVSRFQDFAYYKYKEAKVTYISTLSVEEIAELVTDNEQDKEVIIAWATHTRENPAMRVLSDAKSGGSTPQWTGRRAWWIRNRKFRLLSPGILKILEECFIPVEQTHENFSPLDQAVA